MLTNTDLSVGVLTHTDLSVSVSGFKTHEPFAEGTILCAPKNRLGSRIFVTFEISMYMMWENL